jgi:hypothetical protein
MGFAYPFRFLCDLHVYILEEEHMSEDIVARLRQFDKDLVEEIVNGDHGKDGEHWVIPFDCLCEAADEIERLRKERDEARREVCGFAASDIDRAGRIEVRGLVSGLLAVSRKPTRPVDIARSRNWDCFKGATRGDD